MKKGNQFISSTIWYKQALLADEHVEITEYKL